MSEPNSLSFAVAKMGTLIPALRYVVNCPGCKYAVGALASVVVHLNDDHRWTRESIADWLETLDVDLDFGSNVESPNAI